MSKKFTVVKFSGVSTYGRNPYKCIPSWWIIERDVAEVTVPYPPRTEIVRSFKNIINCEPPINGWNEYRGTIEHETDSYAKGLMFIKNQDSSCNPEELIFIKYLTESVPPSKTKFNVLLTYVEKMWLRLSKYSRK